MKQKAITVILTLIAILAPLLIIPSKDDTNYNILKLIILLVSGLALLILILTNYKNLTIDKKDVIILIFLGLVFISTFLSSNIKTSIIGEENRFEGLLMFITYICIYLCSKKFFKYEKISIFLNIMFCVSILIGILGIAQNYVEYPKYIELYPIFNKKICSTFGNSNFFGSFISLVLPIAIASFIFTGTKRGFILSIIMFFNMISSGTRSAWVAFVFVGLLGLIYLIKQKKAKYFVRAIILAILFIVIFMYLFNGFESIFSKFENSTKDNVQTSQGPNIPSTTEIKINQIKNELKQVKETGLSDKMGSGRIEIWKFTLKLISKKPILGCGPDNLWDGLVQNCTEEIYEYAKKTHIGIDKAHNEYLQIAATIGIPALVCYLIFIAFILVTKIKLAITNKTYYIILISIISYLVQAFFNISTIGVAPLFWMLLGLIDNKEMIVKFDKVLNDKL